MKLVPYAHREIGWGAAILGVLGIVSGIFYPVALIGVGLLALAYLSFFRDPDRKAPEGDHLILAPADGCVTDITDLDHVEYLDGPGQRLGIFLALYNVHVNRAPVSGTVDYRNYQPGKFHKAYKDEAILENESLTMGMKDCPKPIGKMVIRQVSGFAARRIVNEAKAGDQLSAGERYGMIKLGSRTEVIVKQGTPVEWKVKKGDRVKGGKTIIGELK